MKIMRGLCFLLLVCKLHAQTPFTVDGSTVYVSGGRVGIRTTSPATSLDVNGDAQFGTGTAKSTFTAAGLLKLTSAGIQWADGSVTVSSGGGAGHLAAYFSTSTAKHIDRPTYSAWANNDSIPQISGGYQIVNGSMTATTTSDKVIFQWSVPICEPADNCTYGVICLFQDGNANAFCCSQYDLELFSVQRYTWAGSCERQVSDLPTSDTSSHYYTLKIGDNGGSCISINGCAARYYGGASRATFTGQVWTP